MTIYGRPWRHAQGIGESQKLVDRRSSNAAEFREILIRTRATNDAHGFLIPGPVVFRWRVVVWRIGRASDEEALRMMLAYLTISDPAKRKEILTLTERYAIEIAPRVVPNNSCRGD